MSGSETNVTSLPCDRSAPRLARRWVSEHLNPLGLQRQRHDGAVLLVSELVSDVVLRAHHVPVVTVRIDPDEVVVGVADVDADLMGPAADAAADELRDRIAEQVVDRWGERYEDDGTHVVWFSVATAA